LSHPFIRYNKVVYRSNGSRFGEGEWEFLILKRKRNIRGLKTELYLLQVRPSKQYISSLYPVGSDRFCFEWKGLFFSLKRERGKVEIVKLAGMSWGIVKKLSGLNSKNLGGGNANS